MKYLINMSYDGSKFYGYQRQNNKISVAGEIDRVLSKILNSEIKSVGASRTDKGVHAINQYAHFETDKVINPGKLASSMNKLIDEGIHIKNISLVSDEFHARFDVKNKEYIYKINMGEYNPIEKDYTLQYGKVISKKTLDLFINKMNGEHNFKSFTSDKLSKNYIRNINIDYKIKENILILRFRSSGFLRYMIRNIVGLLIDINDNKKSVNDIEKIFDDKNRCSLGKCISGCGLYLNKIEY